MERDEVTALDFQRPPFTVSAAAVFARQLDEMSSKILSAQHELDQRVAKARGAYSADVRDALEAFEGKVRVAHTDYQQAIAKHVRDPDPANEVNGRPIK